MSRTSPIIRALAVTFALTTPAAAQDVPEVNNRFTLVSADPNQKIATLSDGIYERAMDCDQLAGYQERHERQIALNASNLIALGTLDQRY